MSGTGGNIRINLDGVVSTRPSAGRQVYGFSILFCNGFLEATKVYVGYGQRQRQTGLPSTEFETTCMQLVQAFRTELRHLGQSGEMVAMFSLLHADQVELGIDRNRYVIGPDDGLFDRKHVLIPDVLLPAEQTVEAAMKPLFDLVWQASGIPRSLNYNEAGERIP